MTITDPVVGGIFLNRAAIRSPNFNPGVDGWTINEDGTAQFFNIVLVGNDLKVLGANGSMIELTSVLTQAQVLLTPPAQGGVVITPADLFAFGVDSGTAHTKPALQLQSPSFNGNAQAAILVQGMSADTTVAQLIDFEAKLLQVNGSRVYVITHDDNFDCSSLLTLTGAAQSIFGCSATYNLLRPGAKWTATLYTDAGNGATTGCNTIGELTVDAGGGPIAQAGQAIWRAGAVINSGSMPSRQWSGTYAPGGTLTFQATGRQTGANGVYATPNTTLHIQIME